jgi:hypothetical protein
MKKNILLLCLLLTFSGNVIFAQMTGPQRKEWKKKARIFVKNPQSLKKLVDDKALAEGRVEKLNSENSDLKRDLDDANGKIAQLEAQLAQLRTEAAATRAELDQIKNSGQSISRTDFNTGIVYKVQIGAFRKKDLSRYFDNNPNFGGEVGKEPTEPQRINIGLFRDYWESDIFKKYLREMGVRDAWIVPYKDGSRVDLKAVLDQVTYQKAEEK